MNFRTFGLILGAELTLPLAGKMCIAGRKAGFRDEENPVAQSAGILRAMVCAGVSAAQTRLDDVCTLILLRSA